MRASVARGGGRVQGGERRRRERRRRRGERQDGWAGGTREDARCDPSAAVTHMREVWGHPGRCEPHAGGQCAPRCGRRRVKEEEEALGCREGEARRVKEGESLKEETKQIV